MAVLAVGCLPAPGRAAAAAAPDVTMATDPATFFNTAVSSHESGDYQKAIDNARKVLSLVPATAADMTEAEKAQLGLRLEAMYFTIGASYFSMKDWPQATTALTDYLNRYPHGTRLAEARFALGQAAYFGRNYEEAAKTFATLENEAAYREMALLFEGLSYKDGGKNAEAIGALEKLYAQGITSPTVARGAMRLVVLYSERNQPDKAFKVLADLQNNLGFVENVVELNGIALKQGDAFLESNKGGDAIVCYRAVRTRNEVITLQRERIAGLQHQSDAMKVAMRADPKRAGQYFLPLRRMQDAVAEDQALVQSFEKTPNFRPQLLYRLGRAFALINRPWEALVAYRDILPITKDEKEREPALFAIASAYLQVNRPAVARATCDQYLKEYPKGPNASTIGYMLGASALQEGEPKLAEGYFGRMLTEQPDSSLAAEMRFLLANAKFAQSKFDEAKTEYETYQKQFPDSQHKEECVYRIALGNLFSTRYEDALKQFNDYIEHYGTGKFGGGQFLPDAKYRRMVCLYAAQKFDDVAAGCQTWLQEYPDDPQQGEVGALLGDAYMGLGQTDQALPVYQRSYKTATTNEVLNYSIQEAAKILQKRGDWTAVDAMFSEFVSDHPDHPTVAVAMTWMARAKTKEGKVEEAKHFMADYIKKYIDDSNRGAVDNLIDQLAALCARRKAAAPSPSPAPSAAPGTSPALAASPAPSVSPGSTVALAAASPAPEPAPVDPTAEMDSLLGSAGQDQRPTAQARILYAKAQLARLRRREPECNRLLCEIGTRFKPVELSAVILGQSGDALLAAGNLDAAAPLYQMLMDDFPKSEVIDFAYCGLGEIAYRKAKFAEALGYFEDGTFKIVPALKLKDLTVGRARAQFALEHYDEAKKLFEQIASTKEWRGEVTAFSIYSMAQIEAKRERWTEANGLYQRVFLSYPKFASWAAKAYLGSAESLEKLGKPQDAIRIYQEMLGNQKFADLPEANQARERLKAMGAG